MKSKKEQLKFCLETLLYGLEEDSFYCCTAVQADMINAITGKVNQTGDDIRNGTVRMYVIDWLTNNLFIKP